MDWLSYNQGPDLYEVCTNLPYIESLIVVFQGFSPSDCQIEVKIHLLAFQILNHGCCIFMVTFFSAKGDICLFGSLVIEGDS